MKFKLTIDGYQTDQLHDLDSVLTLAEHYLTLGIQVEIIPVLDDCIGSQLFQPNAVFNTAYNAALPC